MKKIVLLLGVTALFAGSIIPVTTAKAFNGITPIGYYPCFDVDTANYKVLDLPYEPNQGSNQNCWACCMAAIYHYRFGSRYQYYGLNKKTGETKTYYAEHAFTVEIAGGDYYYGMKPFEATTYLSNLIRIGENSVSCDTYANWNRYNKVLPIGRNYCTAPSFDIIKENIDKKYPVYIQGEGITLHNVDTNNVTKSYSGGHAMLVVGYKILNNKKYIVVYTSNNPNNRLHGTYILTNYDNPTSATIKQTYTNTSNHRSTVQYTISAYDSVY